MQRALKDNRAGKLLVHRTGSLECPAHSRAHVLTQNPRRQRWASPADLFHAIADRFLVNVQSDVMVPNPHPDAHFAISTKPSGTDLCTRTKVHALRGARRLSRTLSLFYSHDSGGGAFLVWQSVHIQDKRSFLRAILGLEGPTCLAARCRFDVES